MGGDEEAWMTLGRASQILDNLIAQNKAKPMIVVMPNGNVAQEAAPANRASAFINRSSSCRTPWTENMKRPSMKLSGLSMHNTEPSPKRRAGLLPGFPWVDFITLHISRYYPDTFDYMGLFSAAIMPDKEVQSKVYDLFDQTLAAQKENGFELYWIAIGKDDFLYKANADFRTKLDAMDFPYIYRESEGGHTWRNWRIYLSEFLPLLFH